MQTVNVFEAKSSLSKLLESIENGNEEEIVIARYGKPVARLTRVRERPAAKRLGIAKGKFEMPESIDADNPEIERLFTGSAS